MLLLAIQQFLAALAAAGELDARTVPVVRPKWRNVGWLTVGISGVLLLISALTNGLSCSTFMAALGVGTGGIVLLAYCVEAKRYGTIAIVVVICFAVLMIGVVYYGQRAGVTTSEEEHVTPSRAEEHTSTPTVGLGERPETPEAPVVFAGDRVASETSLPQRTKPLIAQVYIDNSTNLMYYERCTERPLRAVRAPLSVAIAQGFERAPGCK